MLTRISRIFSLHRVRCPLQDPCPPLVPGPRAPQGQGLAREAPLQVQGQALSSSMGASPSISHIRDLGRAMDHSMGLRAAILDLAPEATLDTPQDLEVTHLEAIQEATGPVLPQDRGLLLIRVGLATLARARDLTRGHLPGSTLLGQGGLQEQPLPPQEEGRQCPRPRHRQGQTPAPPLRLLRAPLHPPLPQAAPLLPIRRPHPPPLLPQDQEHHQAPPQDKPLCPALLVRPLQDTPAILGARLVGQEGLDTPGTLPTQEGLREDLAPPQATLGGPLATLLSRDISTTSSSSLRAIHSSLHRVILTGPPEVVWAPLPLVATPLALVMAPQAQHLGSQGTLDLPPLDSSPPPLSPLSSLLHLNHCDSKETSDHRPCLKYLHCGLSPILPSCEYFSYYTQRVLY